MFCMNCGKELKDGAKFCMSCGTPVGGAMQNPVAEEPDETELLKEQYESLMMDVEAKRAECARSKNEAAEIDKVRLDLINIHEEIESMLKNAKANDLTEEVVTPQVNLESKAENAGTQKRFCPKCGARVDNARFCGKCGNKMF